MMVFRDQTKTPFQHVCDVMICVNGSVGGWLDGGGWGTPDHAGCRGAAGMGGVAVVMEVFELVVVMVVVAAACYIYLV